MDDESQLFRLEVQLLAARAQGGDLDAFRQLVARFDRRLLYFITRLVDDPEIALDVLQDAWLTVHRGLGKLKSPEAFPTWLYRIARGKSIDELRRRKRALPVADADVLEPGNGEDTPLVIADIDLVHATLERMSQDHREVLVLYFLEDMSLEEIAQVTGYPLGTIKSRMYYAKRAFRSLVGETVYDR